MTRPGLGSGSLFSIYNCRQKETIVLRLSYVSH